MHNCRPVYQKWISAINFLKQVIRSFVSLALLIEVKEYSATKTTKRRNTLKWSNESLCAMAIEKTAHILINAKWHVEINAMFWAAAALERPVLSPFSAQPPLPHPSLSKLLI